MLSWEAKHEHVKKFITFTFTTHFHGLFEDCYLKFSNVSICSSLVYYKK